MKIKVQDESSSDSVTVFRKVTLPPADGVKRDKSRNLVAYRTADGWKITTAEGTRYARTLEAVLTN